MNYEAILSISLNKPEKLYPNNLEEAKLIRNKLVKEWHPDICKHEKAQAVVDHIQKLYDAVTSKIDNNLYGKNELNFSFKTAHGQTITFQYSRKIPFQLGHIYYSKTEIMWHVSQAYRNLVSKHSIIKNNLVDRANTDYKTILTINQSLPTATIIQVSSDYILFAKKYKQFLLLKDVLDKFDRAEHVGWALNRVYENLTCLHSQGIYIGDLSPTNLWVDPKAHKIIFVNGFWFGGAEPLKPDAVPDYCLGILPKETIKTNPKLLDQYLVKRLGRLLLGDVSGMGFKMNPKIPKLMATFLTSDPLKNISEDHAAWKEVLQTCFGDPKFIEMNVDIDSIYGD